MRQKKWLITLAVLLPLMVFLGWRFLYRKPAHSVPVTRQLNLPTQQEEARARQAAERFWQATFSGAERVSLAPDAVHTTTRPAALPGDQKALDSSTSNNNHLSSTSTAGKAAPVGAEKQYYVRLGTFQSKQNAQKMALQLARTGAKSLVVQGASGRYLVVLNQPFSSMQAAENKRQQLKKAGLESTIVFIRP